MSVVKSDGCMVRAEVETIVVGDAEVVVTARPTGCEEILALARV